MNKNLVGGFTEEECKQIEQLVATFRQAIEHCDPGRLPITLQSFPHGACGDASLLLAEYLHEQGYGRADYVLGNREGCSHVWLELHGAIIDITADQFEDYPESRFVLRKMAWHRQFLPAEKEVADFKKYDARTVATLSSAYLLVKRALQKPTSI